MSVLKKEKAVTKTAAERIGIAKIREQRPKQKKFKVKFHHLRVGNNEYSLNDIAELDPTEDWVKRAVANGQLEPVK